MLGLDATRLRPLPPSAALTLALVLAAACSPGPGSARERGSAAPNADGAAVSGAEEADFGFPVGPAVLVRAGYEPPTDRVAATGGYLPVNGKPTLVFAESIT